MELTERKKKVLRSVVDLYIRTAEPVGSKAITELPDMKYSSATIRNEMAEALNCPSFSKAMLDNYSSEANTDHQITFNTASLVISLFVTAAAASQSYR